MGCFSRKISSVAPLCRHLAVFGTQKVIKMIKRGQYAKAIHMSDLIHPLFPTSEAIFLNKAHALFLLDKYEECVTVCTKALQINDQCYIGWEMRGACHAKLKNFTSAIFDLERAWSLNIKDTQISVRALVSIYAQQQNCIKTKIWLERVEWGISMSNDQFVLIQLYNHSQWENLLYVCDKILEKEKQIVSVLMMQGKAYKELRMWENGANAYARALPILKIMTRQKFKPLDLNQKFFIAWMGLGECLAQCPGTESKKHADKAFQQAHIFHDIC
jgi:tetratricopeptide (TPR) repeat protein